VLGCTSAAAYRWRLPTGGAETSTSWTISRDDATAINGTLVHENHDCPDSRIEWTLLVTRSISGTLTARSPDFALSIPLREPLATLTIAMRRLDSAACPSTLAWTDPDLERPAFRFPWS
jgi:hypothetical protein